MATRTQSPGMKGPGRFLLEQRVTAIHTELGEGLT